MTTTVDALVDRYLTDLEAELEGLPADRRREILDEVGEHIAAARATLDAESEAAIRNVLERLAIPPTSPPRRTSASVSRRCPPGTPPRGWR